MRLARFLVYLTAARILAAAELFTDRSHHEGDQCRADARFSSPGVCRKVTDCAPALQQIARDGANGFRRCGFDNYTEVVCCPEMPERNVDDCPEIRPSEVHPSFNGEVVVHHEFPFIAALGYKTRNGIEFACGGSLITRRHILTAAHCVHNKHRRVPVIVQLGALNVTGTEDSVQTFAIQDIIWHKEHRISRFYNDIAILRLSKPISYTLEVLPINLPQPKHMEELRSLDPSLTVAGWGRTDIDAPLSDNLIKVEALSLADREVCVESYKDVIGVQQGLADYMVCVTDRNATRMADTCPGDSGGPLLITKIYTRILIGVTSFGQGCGGSVPGVYTAIPPFLEWIRLVLCQFPTDG